MKFIKHLRFVMLLSCLSAFSSITFGDTFYKWIDENGTTHYGSKPSDQHASDPVHTSGRASGPNSRMAPSKEAEKNTEEAPAEGSVAYDADEVANYCKSIKNRLDLMIAKSRIKQRNKDGSVVMLSEEQRQQQITDLKSKMAEHCN